MAARQPRLDVRRPYECCSLRGRVSRSSVDNFLDGAADSLTETVEENLHGVCHVLDSTACLQTMSDKTSELLLSASARSSTGYPQSV